MAVDDALVPAGDGSAQTTSCLSVFGLPFDATEREVHILFSACEGYSRCIVAPGKKAGARPFAFVQFETPEHAAFAMESRQGTTWGPSEQPAVMKPAHRDIPENFLPRQGIEAKRAPPAQEAWGEPWPKRPRTTAPGGLVPGLRPAGKGPGKGTAGKGPGKGTAGKGPGKGSFSSGKGAAAPAAAAPGEGPRTVHLGSLPPGMSQQDLDSFLLSTFGEICIGSALNDHSGGTKSCRAFVGFATHEDAQEALSVLEGFDYDGTTLRAEWARSEFRPAGVAPEQGAARTAFLSPKIPPAHRAPVTVPPRSASTRPHSAIGARGYAPAKRTLHFTGLPHMDSPAFDDFLNVNFPGQVECSNFRDDRDGRPPRAWVLFVDEETAASVAGEYENFDLDGATVHTMFAKTELNPQIIGS